MYSVGSFGAFGGGIMANKKNLIQQDHTLTLEEQSMGGKASAEKRKKQKAYKELLSEMFTTKISDEKLKAFAEQYGIKDPDVKTLTLLGMINAAIAGNHKAFDALLEMSGEKTQDKNADVINKLDKILGDIDVIADE